MKPYEVKNERKAEHEVDKIFLDRWSPRSLNPEMSEEELMVLFEAARWTPSSSNGQPWRFLYAKNGSKDWDLFFNLLGDFNKMWCGKAGFLIVLISRKNFEPDEKGEEKEDALHSFGAGSAFMSLALQARMKNFIVHGMAGFDYDKAREDLGVPDNYQVDCMIAVGKQGEIEEIPERMQKSEKPNSRKEVSEISFEGKFPGDWS
jgi:nitroreductase